jgi:hypothetical protein
MENLTAEDKQMIVRFVETMFADLPKRERLDQLRRVYDYILYCLEQYEEAEDFDATKMGKVEYWLSHFGN